MGRKSAQGPQDLRDVITSVLTLAEDRHQGPRGDHLKTGVATGSSDGEGVAQQPREPHLERVRRQPDLHHGRPRRLQREQCLDDVEDNDARLRAHAQGLPTSSAVDTRVRRWWRHEL